MSHFKYQWYFKGGGWFFSIFNSVPGIFGNIGDLFSHQIWGEGGQGRYWNLIGRSQRWYSTFNHSLNSPAPNPGTMNYLGQNVNSGKAKKFCSNLEKTIILLLVRMMIYPPMWNKNSEKIHKAIVLKTLEMRQHRRVIAERWGTNKVSLTSVPG